MDKQQKFGVRKNCLAPDTILKDKYRIGVLLGVGNFGMTYTAFDTVLQQMVAVKEFFPNGQVVRETDGMNVVVLPDAGERFAAGKSAFKDEASRIFGAFDLPGICAVKDYFEANGTAYIVQEYLSGGTLKEYVQQKNNHMMSWDECKEIFLPVLEGLNRIHAMGIIHRDISPDNLMFSSSGELKLIDFGAARYHASSDETMAVKEYYAPPEQYKDNQMIGPWSDLYALCSVMYEMLTGRKPVSALTRMKKDGVTKISSYTIIPEKDENAILQGMALDIQKRYFYAGNFMEKLGMDVSDAKIMLGKIRSLWGEAWLQSITEKTMDIQEDKKFRLNIQQKRRLFAVILAAVIAVGGGLMYLESNPEKVFDFKLNQARKSAAEINGKGPVVSGTSEYDRILEAIEPYEKEASSGTNDGVTRYEVPEEVLKRIGFSSRGKYGQGKFYLDKTTMLDIFSYYLDKEFVVDYTEYYGSVNKEKLYEKSYLYMYGHKYESYEYICSTGEKQNFTMSFDPVDERINYISFSGGIEEMEIFLKKIFPYLVPETYMTDEEIEEALRTTRELFDHRSMLGEEEENESVSITRDIHSKFNFSIYSYRSFGSEYAKITIYPGAERNTYY